MLCRAGRGAVLRPLHPGPGRLARAELQVEGRDPTYRGVKVVPFLATLPDTAGGELAQRVKAGMADASCALPATVRCRRRW